jgi:hypothetical protein
MGETMMRLARVSWRSDKGEKREVDMFDGER